MQNIPPDAEYSCFLWAISPNHPNDDNSPTVFDDGNYDFFTSLPVNYSGGYGDWNCNKHFLFNEYVTTASESYPVTLLFSYGNHVDLEHPPVTAHDIVITDPFGVETIIAGYADRTLDGDINGLVLSETVPGEYTVKYYQHDVYVVGGLPDITGVFVVIPKIKKMWIDVSPICSSFSDPQYSFQVHTDPELSTVLVSSSSTSAKEGTDCGQYAPENYLHFDFVTPLNVASNPSWIGTNYMTYTNTSTLVPTLVAASPMYTRPNATPYGYDPWENYSFPVGAIRIYGHIPPPVAAYTNTYDGVSLIPLGTKYGMSKCDVATTTPPAHARTYELMVTDSSSLVDTALPANNDNQFAGADSTGNGDSTVNGDSTGLKMYYASLTPGARWIAQMNTWEAMLADSTLADSSAALTEFAALAGNSRYAWLTTIDTTLGGGDTATAAALLGAGIDDYTNTYADRATLVTMADGKEADDIVGNYLQYYNLELKYMEDTLNSDDSTALDGLANMCPSRDGMVVYKARSLYYMLYGVVVTPDDNCDGSGDDGEQRQSGKGITVTDGRQRYSLYPNPTDGHITLVQAMDDVLPVKVQVYSAMGQSLDRRELQFAHRNANLVLENITPGMYLLQLTDSNGKVYNLKFVVQ